MFHARTTAVMAKAVQPAMRRNFAVSAGNSVYDKTAMNMLISKKTKLITQGFTGKQVGDSTSSTLRIFLGRFAPSDQRSIDKLLLQHSIQHSTSSTFRFFYIANLLYR
ncbi:hypothetical protein BDK51DRAFT_42724 [Blyttiomyces helicus]|uniref:Uncharacterized protein n=1 Tax=Blyttiomyces helicus TaxID=388810 RepID=A0A4P9WDE5_9FUNG|nr:hypothetical protein BDK51DRAFT_42724 [Blyttiomyces helicus]|eukprot:RKO89735.1 hypothetical protein BDK51DRAFT_42724 [Blyttiomyces helicus]